MTDGQRRALDQYWPRFGLSVCDGVQDWQHSFANEQPVVIEIGFGMGDSLFEMASQHVDTNYVGVEVHRPGVGHLLGLAAAADLSNLKLFNEDALAVLEESVCDRSVDRIQIFFPDPWHKKKHHKRRLLNREFVLLMSRKLKPGGGLHIATDWQNYAEEVIDLLDELPMFKPVAAPMRTETKYERRGLRLGHEVFDLCYELVDEH
jgi:tRNA (guanine-N7-)-methyltransferase